MRAAHERCEQCAGCVRGARRSPPLLHPQQAAQQAGSDGSMSSLKAPGRTCGSSASPRPASPENFPSWRGPVDRRRSSGSTPSTRDPGDRRSAPSSPLKSQVELRRLDFFHRSLCERPSAATASATWLALAPRSSRAPRPHHQGGRRAARQPGEHLFSAEAMGLGDQVLEAVAHASCCADVALRRAP